MTGEGATEIPVGLDTAPAKVDVAKLKQAFMDLGGSIRSSLTNMVGGYLGAFAQPLQGIKQVAQMMGQFQGQATFPLEILKMSNRTNAAQTAQQQTVQAFGMSGASDKAILSYFDRMTKINERQLDAQKRIEQLTAKRALEGATEQEKLIANASLVMDALAELIGIFRGAASFVAPFR
jgi:hypothetical protein